MDRGFFVKGIEADNLIERFESLACGVASLNEMLRKLPQPTDLIPRYDVAKMFRVSLVTIDDWTTKGLLQSYKIANRVYYKRAEIEKALVAIHPKR